MSEDLSNLILLVEDEEGIGLPLMNGLSEAGYLVTWHRTGLSALAEAAQVRFNLVLLDLGLPDSDGVEICRDLRACQPQSVIVMLTARRDEMDLVVGLEAGADDYITKPFGLAWLLDRIRILLADPQEKVAPVIPLRRHHRARTCAHDDFLIREGPYNWE